MKRKNLVSTRADRKGRMSRAVCVAVAWMATFLVLPAMAPAAGPGGPTVKSNAVTFESIPGSAAKRVILTAKAAERLGIEIGKVSVKPIVRRQIVSGLLVPRVEKPPDLKPAIGVFGGFERIGFGTGPEKKPAAARTNPPPAGDVWVLVTLSESEWEKVEKNRPARLFPLETRVHPGREILAKPSGMPPLDDMKRSMLWLYYVIPGKDHGLKPNTRMRVELELSGNNEKHKVVPYGAVYYDGKGDSWVYVNQKPLVFERQRVAVKRVEGDLALLSEGPPVGTDVVTVGAAMLFGAEIFGK